MKTRVGLLVTMSVPGVLLAATAQAQTNEETQRAQVTLGPDVAAEQPAPAKKPRRPVIGVQAGGGIVGFLGGAAALGPAWNARVSAYVTPRFAVEVNYTGASNDKSATGTNLLMTAVDGSVRYNLLAAYELPFQPFVTAGLGWAGFSGTNGDMGTMTIPLSAGLERMITPLISGGARLEFRPALFDHLGEPNQPLDEQPGGDTWAILAHVGGAF